MDGKLRKVLCVGLCIMLLAGIMPVQEIAESTEDRDNTLPAEEATEKAILENDEITEISFVQDEGILVEEELPVAPEEETPVSEAEADNEQADYLYAIQEIPNLEESDHIGLEEEEAISGDLAEVLERTELEEAVYLQTENLDALVEASIAASGTCGRTITWTLDNQGKVTLSGSGDMQEGSPFFLYRSQIKSVVIESGITSIGGEVFRDCSSLTSVTIPNGVTRIGHDAFRGCSSLKSVSIPGTVNTIGYTAFSNCSSLTAVTVPDSVTDLGSGAFYECSNMTGVKLPATLSSVGAQMFYKCVKLSEISIPSTVTSIMSDAFNGCSALTEVTIPDNVTEIGDYAFYECRNLKSIKVPDGLKTIGQRAFAACKNITSFTLPNGLTSLGEGAFLVCEKITSITIPAGLTRLEQLVFADCGLTDLTIPANITNIGPGAISCSSLSRIHFLGNAPEIDDIALEDVVADAYYHPEKSGWSSSVLQNYGGTIHWIAGTPSKFTDVADPEAYYHDPVYWAVELGITSGTSPTTFSPNKTCTRGQIVTFLWKALKSPEPSSANNPFTDVKESDYFYQPVLWAKENKITSGTSATTFSPMNPCTRGQIMTFLWIALGRPEPASENNPFTDVSAGDYFYKPVLWAVEKGITAGTSATTFSPGKACTRAQAMTFLYKAMN